jgi:hypothetical protein
MTGDDDAIIGELAENDHGRPASATNSYRFGT